MDGNPTIVVRKSGFFAAVAKGFFGLLMTLVVCVTVLGVFALRLVDHKADSLAGLAGTALSQLRHWQEILPPAVADAIHDRRALEEAASVAVDAHVVDGPNGPRMVFSVANNSDEVITLLALDVTVRNGDLPIDTFTMYAATPLATEHGSWRGPLPPGAKRELVRRFDRGQRGHFGFTDRDGERKSDGNLDISATPVELRVAEPRPLPAASEPVALDVPHGR
jgi:hypothetical protein